MLRRQSQSLLLQAIRTKGRMPMIPAISRNSSMLRVSGGAVPMMIKRFASTNQQVNYKHLENEHVEDVQW